MDGQEDDPVLPSSTDEEEERRRARFAKFLQWVGAPLGAAVYWLGRSLYHESYADALGLPSELGLMPPVSVGPIVTSALTGFTVLNLVSVLVGRPGQLTSTAKGRLLFRFILVALPIAWLCWLIWQAERDWTWLLGLVPLAVIVFIEFSVLFVDQRQHRGFEAKLEAAESRDQVVYGIGDRIRPWGGRLAVIMLVLICLLLVLARAKGRADARSKTEWTVVTHPDLATTSTWILVAADNNRLLVGRAERGELQGPLLSLSVAPTATQPISYEIRRVGRLRRPKPEPLPPPTSAPTTPKPTKSPQPPTKASPP